jgi:predicted AAA+ superfamily ATPase
LLAGRTGQLLNQSNLGNELGLDNKTIDAWISLLEVSFVAFRLQPYFRNFNKRIVKTPKVYFYDTGLLAYQLGIRSELDLDLHYAKGQIFENLILADLMKQNWNQQLHNKHYFWRDAAGHEVDILMEQGMHLKSIEVKSSKTFHVDFMDNLKRFKTLRPETESYVVFGGTGFQTRGEVSVLGLEDLKRITHRTGL